MKKLLILAIAAAAMILNAEALFSNGKTKWSIVLPSDKDQVMQYAAEELSTALQKISGVKFPVSTTAGKKFNIFLGTPQNSPVIGKLKNTLRLPGENAIDTVAVYAQNENLYLAGNNPRSVLYAVYAFLQNQLGVRWYWPGDDGEFITKRQSYTLPGALKYNYTPPFKIRAFSPCHWHRHVPTEIWLARNFLNGDSRTLSIRDKAGFIRITGGHRVTVYNAKKVFDLKPELFSLIAGRRDRSGYAGCWSNPEFTKQVIDNVAKLIKKNNAEIINIFPADITQRCECEKCSVNPDRSSRWFNYYYQLITELKKQFPKLKFAGIAYQEYRAIPTSEVKGLEYVEYCHYNRCYAHKLDDPSCKINARSMKELRAWKKKAPIGIYGYEFDIFNPATMLANWKSTADAMRTYRDLQAVRVKTEMSVYYPKNTPRAKLTPQINRIANWMWAQLVWNPDADVSALLKDWCQTVYGKEAAPFMYAYLDEMATAWQTQKNHPTYFGRTPVGTVSYLFNDKRLKFCRTQLAKAAKAVKKSSKRHQDEVKLETEIFSAWEKYYNLSGSKPTVMPPYQPEAKDFANALKLPLKVKKNNAGKQPKPTTMKVFWTDQALRLEVTAMEPDMKNLRMAAKEHDGNVWKDDSVEILLDPGDGQPFRQLVVTAGGTRYDALANDSAYNPEWKAVVTRAKDRWTADITLPFASFGGKDKKSWQLMVIRNSKPVAIGFPAPMHMDISSAGTIWFSKKASTEKTMAFITKANAPSAFDVYRNFFFNNGWSCDVASGEKAASELDLTGKKLILLESYQTRFSDKFWSEKIAPAVKNGATLIIRSYFWLDMLGKSLGDASYAVKCKEDSHKIRRPEYFAPGFADNVHDLRKRYRSCGTVTFYPKHPELWTTLVAQKTKNNTRGNAVICRKFGKGKIVIIGQPRGGLLIIDNILAYDPDAKYDEKPAKPVKKAKSGRKKLKTVKK